MTSHRLKLLIGAAAIATASTAIGNAAHSADYFAGKTINLIVGFSAGGTDMAARVFVRHIGRHIPGNPTVVVKNMPGAASAKAQNFVYEKARPDGLTISFNPFSSVPQLVGAAGVRFKYEKFTFIAGTQGTPFIVIARTDAVPGGLKKPLDILKAPRLAYAGRSALHTMDMPTTVTMKILDKKYNYVPGFRAVTKIRTSLETNETNITSASLGFYKNVILPSQFYKNGDVKAVWYFPGMDGDGNWLKSDIVPPGIPSLIDVFQDKFGGLPKGPDWEALKFFASVRTMNFFIAAPPGTDDKIADILRKGFKAAIEDERTKAEERKVLDFAYNYVDHESAKKTLLRLANADPKIVKYWKDHIDAGNRR